MNDKYKNLFKLKKPCNNCPFLKEGAIELREGRLNEIIKDISENDLSVFYCHKTVHNGKTGGEWTEEEGYKPSGLESVCAGSIIYLEKIRKPSVFMRLGRVLNVYLPSRLQSSFDSVIERV